MELIKARRENESAFLKKKKKKTRENTTRLMRRFRFTAPFYEFHGCPCTFKSLRDGLISHRKITPPPTIPFANSNCQLDSVDPSPPRLKFISIKRSTCALLSIHFDRRWFTLVFLLEEFRKSFFFLERFKLIINFIRVNLCDVIEWYIKKDATIAF